MELSSEEKQRIYEEEKARLEARERLAKEKQTARGKSTTTLQPNKAGLFCYLGFWVTGIIFLSLEKKNKLVRFHAMQSIVVFGILNIIWGVADTIRISAWSGGGLAYPNWVVSSAIFGTFFALWWIFWGVLMYRTYHNQLHKVPWAGDFAERMLAKLDGDR